MPNRKVFTVEAEETDPQRGAYAYRASWHVFCAELARASSNTDMAWSDISDKLRGGAECAQRLVGLRFGKWRRGEHQV